MSSRWVNAPESGWRCTSNTESMALQSPCTDSRYGYGKFASRIKAILQTKKLKPKQENSEFSYTALQHRWSQRLGRILEETRSVLGEPWPGTSTSKNIYRTILRTCTIKTFVIDALNFLIDSLSVEACRSAANVWNETSNDFAYSFRYVDSLVSRCCSYARAEIKKTPINLVAHNGRSRCAQQ